MKTVFCLFWLSVFLAALALPQAGTTTSSSPKASPPAALPKNAATTAKKNTPTKTAAKKNTKKKTVSRPPVQIQPTKDRYREIQQALADKGYLKSEPNGVWDGQSAEALRQFQTDRKLDPTGKINAPSLIGLGLGPKFDEGSAVPPGIPDQAPNAGPDPPRSDCPGCARPR